MAIGPMLKALARSGQFLGGSSVYSLKTRSHVSSMWSVISTSSRTGCENFAVVSQP